jgi:NAD(P)-dependent dehydrogenase (short-subunit alcohol dehydrogenase family)
VKVAGAVALVTGANRGIGEGFVQVLLARGCSKVYAAARDPELLPDFADARVVPLPLDVTQRDQCVAAARQAADLSLLINNAGLSHFGTTLLHDQCEQDLRDEMEVNLFGIFNTFKAFHDVLGRNGGGVIVNILSAAALMNVPLLSTYSVTKAAALSLTQAIRAATAAQKTLVTAAIVGSVDTRMAEDVPKEVVKVSPAFVANAVLDGVERNEEEIDTDPMAIDVRARIARDPKKMERYFARGLQLARKA